MSIYYNISRLTFWAFWVITVLVVIGATSTPVEAESIQHQGELPSVNDVAAYLFLALSGILVWHGKTLISDVRQLHVEVRQNREDIVEIRAVCKTIHAGDRG